jgi:predicted DNA-binding ribbon-helix-helix protein
VSPNLRKRSILLAGHATSVALEPEFWAVLEARAHAEGRSLAALMVAIDQARGDRPLASACRLAALAFAQGSEDRMGLRGAHGQREDENKHGA